ncbi:MAG: class I SAM-dependent methyltransferase [Candidatus Heimdallarchaeota archaeon]|nr:class I SAM-dependent methyltransferase [Candidatus Heimdallarchaeota archaeon]
MERKIQISEFPAVSKTALVPLYCKALDYRAKNSILKDKFSYDLYNQIDFDWNIVKKTVRSFDPILMGIRVRKFDEMCRQFLEQHPNGIIVSLGSGIDYRFGRIDNNQCYFVDLDFPEVLEFRKLIIPTSTRNVLIGQSILDYSWIKEILRLSTENQAPVFFIAEGVMVYLERPEMQELLKNIGQVFPHAEIFFDVFSERAKKMAERKIMFKDENVKIKSALNSGTLIEEWGINFKVLSEWYLSDDPDAKRGWMKLVWVIPTVKKLEYFIHGKFEK